MERLIDQAMTIWWSGGWAMIALAGNALILFAIGFHVWLGFMLRGRTASCRDWREQVRDPSRRNGAVGRWLDFALGAHALGELQRRFDEIRSTELAPVRRDLGFMRRAVSTAPLLGLLGTVTGMLATFAGLASGGSTDETMGLIAGGISEALVTTETGLLIALPGLIFHAILKRRSERHEAFLAHLEAAAAKHLYETTVVTQEAA